MEYHQDTWPGLPSEVYTCMMPLKVATTGKWEHLWTGHCEGYFSAELECVYKALLSSG